MSRGARLALAPSGLELGARSSPLTDTAPAGGAASVTGTAGVDLLNRYDNETLAFEPNVGAAISTEQETFSLYYEITAEAPTELDVTYAVTEQNLASSRQLEQAAHTLGELAAVLKAMVGTIH